LEIGKRFLAGALNEIFNTISASTTKNQFFVVPIILHGKFADED
jgi:hypothetical protein